MDAFRIYLKEIRHISLLTPEQETKLSERIKKGDDHARKEMIRANLRLVINVAKKYLYLGIPLSDLVEEGNLGLMKAVDKFNSKRGYRFSTYAIWWIRQSITRSIADQGRMIRVPVYINDLIVKWKKERRQLTQKLKRIPTNNEIAKKMRLSKDKLEQVNFWMSNTVSSMETPIATEGENQISDLIEDKNTAPPDDGISRFFNKEKIDSLLEIMSPIEKNILSLRFGLNDTKVHTLAKIAKKYKVSRERIRQIEESSLKKLKKFTQQQQKQGREL